MSQHSHKAHHSASRSGNTLAHWLADTPFTLSLSSGFFGFFAHLGVLQALQQAQLKPARYTGSSAGALVSGCLAAGCSPDELNHTLSRLQREDFWDPAVGLGLLAGKRFRHILSNLLPVTRIEDTPTPLALSVWHGASRSTRVLDHGDLVDAIYASCAVPLLFHPARIDGQRYWDGGIADRHGLAATAASERVFYHHLSSRSPWRRANSPALQVPKRDNLAALVLGGLPRSGPNRLDAGREAQRQARTATMAALQQPVRADGIYALAVS